MQLRKRFLKTKRNLNATYKKVRNFVYPNNHERLEKISRYVDRLYDIKQQCIEDMKILMDRYNIQNFFDGELSNPSPEVLKHPDMVVLYEKISKYENKFFTIFRKYPGIWKPGEEDIALTYDHESVQEQMDQIYEQEEWYLDDLEEQIAELSKKTGVNITINETLNLEDFVIDPKLDEEQANLLDKQIYLTYLYYDAVFTIGDKQGDLLWNSIPKVAKKNYIKFINDSMLEVLAQDDVLAYSIKNFSVLRWRPDLQEKFSKHLEYSINNKFLKDCDYKLKVNIIRNEKTLYIGYYRADEGIKINLHRIKDVDYFVGVLKHEIMGHCFNKYVSNNGLYGETMKDYIYCNNESLFRSGKYGQLIDHSLEQNFNGCSVSIKSVLTNNEYFITGASESELQELGDQGWLVYDRYEKNDYYMYRNSFEERTAWAVTPTKNIQKQIDAFRAKRNMPVIAKVR